MAKYCYPLSSIVYRWRFPPAPILYSSFVHPSFILRLLCTFSLLIFPLTSINPTTANRFYLEAMLARYYNYYTSSYPDIQPTPTSPTLRKAKNGYTLPTSHGRHDTYQLIETALLPYLNQTLLRFHPKPILGESFRLHCGNHRHSVQQSAYRSGFHETGS